MPYLRNTEFFTWHDKIIRIKDSRQKGIGWPNEGDDSISLPRLGSGF